MTLILGKVEPPFRFPATLSGVAVPQPPSAGRWFPPVPWAAHSSTAAVQGPCWLSHSITRHSKLGPLVRKRLPWKSGSGDILSH